MMSKGELPKSLALKTASLKSRMESIDSTLTASDLLRSVNQSRDKGASSWLTAVALIDQGLVLLLTYNMPLFLTKQVCFW